MKQKWQNVENIGCEQLENIKKGLREASRNPFFCMIGSFAQNPRTSAQGQVAGTVHLMDGYVRWTPQPRERGEKRRGVFCFDANALAYIMDLVCNKATLYHKFKVDFGL